MTLLSPIGLLALLLGLPILALYFLRLHRPEARVPSLLLWEAVLADRHANRPWQKLRRNWLLLLQLLIVAALALALARPAIPVPLALHGRVIVLLDVSASMQAGSGRETRLDAARRTLREMAGTLEAGDRVALMAVGSEPRLLVRDGDAAALRQALNSVEAEDGPADWGAAATLAAGLASGTSVTTLLITDAAVDTLIPALPGTVRLIRVGEGLPNSGIVALALRRTSAGLEAFVRVHNAGPAALNRTLTLYADGAPVESRSLELPVGGDATATFGDLPALAWAEARLEGTDALPLDDRAWVALPASAGGRVLVVTSGNRFLVQALQGLPDVAVEESPSLAPVEAAGAAYGLVVIDGAPITGTVPAGNLWLLAPGPGTLCGEPGEVFSDTAPVRGLWDDPRLAYVEWAGVNVAQARRYTPPPDATVLIQAPGGPLLWAVERPGQRVLCSAFALQESDLPLRLAFPILTANLVGWLMPAASAEPVSPLPAGQSWDPPLPAAVTAARLIDPQGKSWPLLPGPAPDLPRRAGLYRVEAETPAGPEVRYAALALLNDAESDLNPRTLVVDGRPLPAVQEEAPGWRELSSWLLLAALGLILVEAVAWWGRSWRFRAPWKGRISLSGAAVLRLLLLALLIPALLGARWTRATRNLAVVFLLDRSASAQATWEEQVAFVKEALARKGADDRAGLVVFGGEAWVDRALTAGPELAEVATFPRTDATNIEEAVRLGLALIPDGAPGRLVLVTDGLETVGRAERALREARVRGVDLVVEGRGSGSPGPEVWISNLRLPTHAYPGDRIPVAVTVETNQSQAVNLIWTAGGQSGQGALSARPGGVTSAFAFTAAEPGFLSVQVCLQGEADTFPQNNCADGWVLVEGAPRVMVVGPAADRTALVSALREAGLTVEERNPEGLPLGIESLVGYAGVVLVNTPARSIAPQSLVALRDFVRDLGGGLVAVGGPDSYGIGGWFETPLEDALPVEMMVRDPRRFPPLAMMVIIDKSGSMTVEEGGVPKIRLAAEAAVRAAEALNDTDTMGVVAYDDRPADTIGPLQLTERDSLTAQLLRLQAGGGGIYVYDSLTYAASLLEQVETLPGQQRHILLLADGSDAERQEGAEAFVAGLQKQGVTVSVISIGSGPDVPFLQRLAETGNGRFYLTQQAADLPAIFSEETMRVKRSYIVEEPFYPLPVSSWEGVSGIAATPILQGYVATTPKSAAQVVWEAREGDPLLAIWQYGLGRSVAWTSDATGRWAAGWVAWEDFARFWGGLVRWTLPEPTDPGVALRVTTQDNRAHAAVDVVAADGTYADGLDLQLNVARPGTSAMPLTVPLRQMAPGRYEGDWPLPEPGVVLLQLNGDRKLTAGWVLPVSLETVPGDASAAVARLLAVGEGHAVVQPGEVFTHDLQGRETGQPLAPLLTLLAALLWPVDVAWRRLALAVSDLRRWGAQWVNRARELWGAWRHRRRKPAGGVETAPTLAGTLRQRARGMEPAQPAVRPEPPVEPGVVRPEPSTPPPAGPAAVKPPAPPAKKPTGGEEPGEEDSLAARLKRRVRS